MKRTAIRSFAITSSFISGLFLMAAVAIIAYPQTPSPQATFMEGESTLTLPEGELEGVGETATIAAAIVPHHLVAQSMIEEVFAQLAGEDPQTIVLVSPDHWGRSQETFTTTAESTYKDAKVNQRIVATYLGGDLGDDFAVSEELLADEHGINGLVPLLLAQMPEVEVVPIAISSNATHEQVSLAVTQLDVASNDRTIVVSSTDFSHYLPIDAANLHDIASIAAISNFETDYYPELELDCWQCVLFASEFAQKRDARAVELVDHGNQATIMEMPDLFETTSYATFLFQEGESTYMHDASLLFVGDIMVGRHVERLMNRHGAAYPFERIEQFLRGVDVLHGNLEGPVVTAHAQTPDFSTSFSFAPAQAANLARVGFNVVSLGNNHTLDRGAQGYVDTKQYLDDVGIAYAGHYNEIGTEFVYETDVRGTPLRFVSFNDTYPGFDRDAAAALVAQEVRASEAITIVNVHWGIEYQLSSYVGQQEFAHALIDAGADVIVGHHPHVTQEIEEYKGKLIFYSLGNFVFDQYFSKDVQESYALGMTIHEEEIAFTIFPLKSVNSQVELMDSSQSRPWLELLAQRSDIDLADDIKKGILTSVNPINYEF